MGIPEIESFRELLHSWTSCLDKAVTTALAFRADDGSWHLSRALTVLYAGELTIDTIYVRTNSIPAFRQVSMISRGSAESFMEAPLADPFMMTCGTETLLVRHHEEAAKRFQFYPFHPRFGRQNLRVCGLRAEVVAVHPLVLERSRLDLELAAQQKPYDGLTELLYALDLNFEGEEFTSQTIVEWLVWPPAFIDQNSSLDCAKLIVRVILQPGAEPMDVRVGLKVFRPAQPLLRRSVDGSSLVWSENKNHILGCYESSEYGETRLVKAFLAYRGAHLGYWWIRDNSRQINDRLSIHNAIDQVGAFRERFFEKEINLLKEWRRFSI